MSGVAVGPNDFHLVAGELRPGLGPEYERLMARGQHDGDPTKAALRKQKQALDAEALRLDLEREAFEEERRAFERERRSLPAADRAKLTP